MSIANVAPMGNNSIYQKYSKRQRQTAVTVGKAKRLDRDLTELTASVEPNIVDAVMTSLPIVIGFIQTGDDGVKAPGRPCMEKSAWWSAQRLTLARRALKHVGHTFGFGNWRSPRSLRSTFSTMRCTLESSLICDKERTGPANPSQLRLRSGFILCTSVPKGQIGDRGVNKTKVCCWVIGNRRCWGSANDHVTQRRALH